MNERLFQDVLTPFRLGNRVRCLVITADPVGGGELPARLGGAPPAAARPSNGKHDTGWAITVDWRFGEPTLRTIHDPEELGIVLS